jgi:hypothetical protein
MAFRKTLDYYCLCELKAQKEPINNPEYQFIHKQCELKLPRQQGVHMGLGSTFFFLLEEAYVES